jgi:predicted nucleic acid-binding protein
MLLDAAIRELAEAEGAEKAVAELREKAEVMNKWASYQLLEDCRLASFRTQFEFGISDFAFAETSHVILDEYINGILRDKWNIPIQFINKTLRKKVALDPEDEHDLMLQVSRFLSIFCEPANQVLVWFEGCDFATASVLITSARISTTDAYLVGSALHNGCTYFVTEDSPLRKLMKERNVRNIEPVSAQAMRGILKGEISPPKALSPDNATGTVEHPLKQQHP